MDVPYLINTCFGGYGISDEVIEKYKLLYFEEYGEKIEKNYSDLERTDPLLIRLYDEYYENGNMKSFNSSYSNICKYVIPYKVYTMKTFKITEYDGAEGIECDVCKAEAKFDIQQVINKFNDLINNYTEEGCFITYEEIVKINTALKL